MTNNLSRISQLDFYSKLLPQAVDVEEAILGAMMLERDCFVNNPVKPEWFYREEHQKIIKCISELVDESIPVDLLQVTKRLKDKGQLDEIGGPMKITELTSRVSSAAHVEFHVRIIQQEFIRRELIRISFETMNVSYDETVDIEDIFSGINNKLANILSLGNDESSTFSDASSELIESISSPVTTGIKSGFHKYDKFAGGFQKSDLVIVAGETSQGKTSFAVTAIKNCAIRGVRCAVFSLEMTKRQLVARIVAQETNISSKKIMYNDLSNVEKSTVLNYLNSKNNWPIHFDESSVNDIDKICTSIRKLKIKYNIELVLVDYIQDMKGADTEAGIGDIGRKLKNIAKELDICVIAISQLARDKMNPEPTISRLRGSGQLEEKADVVILVYRPEYYGRTYGEPHSDESTWGTAQIKIAKGRNIGLGSFIMGFNKETTLFYDYEPRTQIEVDVNSRIERIDRIEPNFSFDNQTDDPF